MNHTEGQDNCLDHAGQLEEILKWFFQGLAVLNPHSCSISFIHTSVFCPFENAFIDWTVD